jgi:hypothetical protein
MLWVIPQQFSCHQLATDKTISIAPNLIIEIFVIAAVFRFFYSAAL